MLVREMVRRQLSILERKNMKPKYISFNCRGYRDLIIEEGAKGFPKEFDGLPIILNPQQNLNEDVVVLADPASEMLYSFR